MLDFFNQKGLDYALIGGFALNAYGRARQTDDIDFLLRDRDAQKTIDFGPAEPASPPQVPKNAKFQFPNPDFRAGTGACPYTRND